MLNNKLYFNITRLSQVVEELNKPQFMLAVSKMHPKQIESINSTLIRIIDSLENFTDHMENNPFMG